MHTSVAAISAQSLQDGMLVRLVALLPGPLRVIERTIDARRHSFRTSTSRS